MTTAYYPAIVERDINSFGVYFPDLPGCVSAGATITDAVAGAEEALRGHLSVSADYGDAVPEPSAIDVIEPAAGSDEVCRILVRGERPGKAVRVQISMDEGLLAQIDRKHKNRSRFLADAAREKLADA